MEEKGVSKEEIAQKYAVEYDEVAESLYDSISKTIIQD